MATLSEGERRRQAAGRHALDVWTCVCGRVCRGNGGQSSHKRACRQWKAHRLAAFERAVATLEGRPDPSNYQARTLDSYRRSIERLRSELDRSS